MVVRRGREGERPNGLSQSGFNAMQWASIVQVG